jgi:hypothetical protein
MIIFRVCFHTPQMRNLFLKPCDALQSHFEFLIVRTHVCSSTISMMPLQGPSRLIRHPAIACSTMRLRRV